MSVKENLKKVRELIKDEEDWTVGVFFRNKKTERFPSSFTEVKNNPKEFCMCFDGALMLVLDAYTGFTVEASREAALLVSVARRLEPRWFSAWEVNDSVYLNFESKKAEHQRLLSFLDKAIEEAKE